MLAKRSRSWTRLTGEEQASSVGSSNLLYEMPLSQLRSDRSILPGVEHATFQATVDTPGRHMAFGLAWSQGEDELGLKMIIGCCLLSMLSEQAVDEALSHLGDLWEFYSTAALPMRTPASTRVGLASGTAVATSPGRAMIVPSD